jgi:hypothetical protein
MAANLQMYRPCKPNLKISLSNVDETGFSRVCLAILEKEVNVKKNCPRCLATRRGKTLPLFRAEKTGRRTITFCHTQKIPLYIS